MNWLDAVPTPQRSVLVRSVAPSPGARLGLIAGWGRVPLRVASSLRARGYRVVVIAVDDEADPALENPAEALYWVQPTRLGRVIELLRRERCEGVVLAGKVRKAPLLSRTFLIRQPPDLTFLRLWLRHRSDLRDGALLGGLAEVLGGHGIPLLSTTELCPNLLAPRGVLGARPPTERERNDAVAGWRVARHISSLDVGQAVVVRDQVVLAVEALEGTDAAIRRAGGLSPSGGFGPVKVAARDQDLRLDAPGIGPLTLRALVESGGTFAAYEAGRTLLLDPEEVIQLADRHGVSLFGMTEEDVQG